jgi:endonuclease YncB( thermonuclease family)
VFISINYTSLNNFVIKNLDNQETIVVDRVIDGDTVVVEKQSYRLLGINTPERGEYLYAEAKKYLEENVMNISLTAESKGKDLYDRELVYLYKGYENINLGVVREGYANTYFPEGKDNHYNEFDEAWKECLNEGKNLCEKSLNKCGSCIEIKEWDMESEEVIFYNKCNFDCSFNKWTIKDEGRKKFVFNNFTLKKYNYVSIIVGDGVNTKDKLYWKNQTYVWTYTGDSLFLRDADGKLVLWETKGY